VKHHDTRITSRVVFAGVAAVAACLFVAASGCQKDPISQALSEMNSDSAQVRLRGATVLLSSPSMRIDSKHASNVEAALLNALADDDPEIRRVVARGLIEWVRPVLVAAAAEAMGKDVTAEDESVRQAAVEVLTEIPAPISTTGLVAALGTNDTATRMTAARALERRQAGLPLDSQIRLCLVLDMHQRIIDQGEEALPALLGMLDADPPLRAAAALAIARVGDADAAAQAAARCLDDLDSEDGAVRAGAVRALGALANQSALERVAALAADDADPAVRATATIAAHVIRQDARPIVAALDGDDSQLQMAAIRGVRDLADKRLAAAPLVRRLGDASDKRLVEEILRSLESCGGLAMDPLMDGVESASDRSIRLRLARALNQAHVFGGMSGNQQFRLYNLQQGEEDETVRTELAQVLAALE